MIQEVGGPFVIPRLTPEPDITDMPTNACHSLENINFLTSRSISESNYDMSRRKSPVILIGELCKSLINNIINKDVLYKHILYPFPFPFRLFKYKIIFDNI